MRAAIYGSNIISIHLWSLKVAFALEATAASCSHPVYYHLIILSLLSNSFCYYQADKRELLIKENSVHGLLISDDL